MKLIITRHGETEENVKGIFQGHLPGKLTKKGKEQAKKLAERLKDEKFDVIFSSDLTRAADTAKEIAKFYPDTPIYFVKDLRERFLGELQGKAKKDLGLDDKKLMAGSIDTKDGESQDEFLKRTKSIIGKIISSDKDVLIVGHGGINAAIISLLTKNNLTKIVKEYQPQPTAVTIFDFDKNKKPKLILMNCVKHLEDSK